LVNIIMTTTGIQVDGTLSVTQLQLDSVDDHKIEGIATFKEVTTLYPVEPPPRQAYQFYIQAEMNLNNYVVQGGPSSTTHPDNEQAAYGLNQIQINSGGSTFNETRNLPVLDGAGVSTSAGTVETAHEANNTASGQFTVTITFLIDNNGDITPTVLVGAGPAQGNTSPDDPLSAEIGYWSHSGKQGGVDIPGDQLAQPAVPAPPSNTADDAGTAAPATLTASQVQTGFQDVLTGIETIYTVNTIESWSMQVDQIPISNVNKIANYARSVQHVGTIHDGHPIFAAGERLVIQNSVAYSVDITPIGGGENVTLIPLHQGASGIFGVLMQGQQGAATQDDVPGYDFTAKTTDGGDTGGDTGPGSTTLPLEYKLEVNPTLMISSGSITAFTLTPPTHAPDVAEDQLAYWTNAYAGISGLPAGLQELYRVFQRNVTVTIDGTTSISGIDMIVVFAYVTSAGENVGKVIALWYPAVNSSLTSYGYNGIDPPPSSADYDLTNKLPAAYLNIAAVNFEISSLTNPPLVETTTIRAGTGSLYTTWSDAASASMQFSEFNDHITNNTSSNV
jgi:hypothetical protein